MERREVSYLSFAKQVHHNSWLDLLRSLAIFLVLLRHGSHIAKQGPAEGFTANLFSNGWVGVDLFFVLSGYLIASGLIRRSATDSSLFPLGYFRDRILRIVPAYYAVLILCTVPAFLTGGEFPAQSFIAHLLFLQDYTGSDINVVFWSLGVEEKFYLAAPFIVFALWKPTNARLGMTLLLLLFLASPLSRALAFEGLRGAASYDEFFRSMRSPFHMSLEGFVAGIAVAIAQAKGMLLSQRRALTGLAGCTAVLIAWLGSHNFLAEITGFDVWFQPGALAMLFGLMVWCGVSLADRKLSIEPFFRVNARLSYALYLVHLPLIPLAAALAPGSHLAGFWAIYLLLSYVAACALHFAVEKPFLNLKQRLKHKGGQAASPGPVRATAS